MRTRDAVWAFHKSFSLKGVDRLLPAGNYRVTTDEELIESLSFPVYRRVATMILVPGQGHGAHRWKCSRSIRRSCRRRTKRTPQVRARLTSRAHERQFEADAG
jgi:hypothetical protein